MKTIGITGSIGTGKSTALKILQEEGIPSWDADKSVSEIYRSDTIVMEQVQQVFGKDAVDKDGVNKSKVKDILRRRPQLIKQLNAIVHPKVKELREKFLRECKKSNKPLVALEIPLLFETGIDKELDYVIVMATSQEEQKNRMKERCDIDKQWLSFVHKWQMEDLEKQKKADFVIQSKSIQQTQSEIRKIIKTINA